MSEERKDLAWYILRTYPGQEGATLERLARRLHDKNLWQPEMELVVPTNVFAGFLLVRMALDPSTWTIARNTSGVTGFVGTGQTPAPFYEPDWHKIPLERWLEPR